MKKFIIKLSFLVPVFGLLLLVNYFGDAAHIFDSNYEKTMAEIVSNGHNVTNIENYDERLFQAELINNKNIRPKFVVIGSSRTMLLNSHNLSSNSFFNNSVSGAGMKDLIALYQLYKVNKKIPQKIMIGIDPWIFNESNNDERWKSIGKYYYQFVNSNVSNDLDGFKYKQLLSFSYFQASLKNIPVVIGRESFPISTNKKYNLTNTKLRDGSLVYEKEYREASNEKIEAKVQSSLKGNLYKLENFQNISKPILNEFKMLILDLKNHNVEIEFFLAPYHPLFYRKIELEYPMVLKTEVLINEFAKQNNLKVYGSFNPHLFRMDSSFFYDGMHNKEVGIKKILSSNKIEK